MQLEKLLSELGFSKQIEEVVRENIRIDEKQICLTAQRAYQMEDDNFYLCTQPPLTRLTVVTYLLMQKYEEYKSKGISDKIIFDTFRDVSLHANLYYQYNNQVGLTEDDVWWFRHIMNVCIFKLGSMQFQPFEMIYLDEQQIGSPYMSFSDEQKSILPPGTPVINCHIQHGTNLSNNSVNSSFAEAEKFFSEFFPKTHYRAFLCYSWLLYPPMLEHLGEQSHIKQFANRFSVLGSCNDYEMAFKHLFPDDKKDGILHPTFLQNLALQHPELFGFACGIIKTDGMC